jgi:hypothetical protein
MKGKLIPVGCNELLDFVRRGHSAPPDLSRVIVSFTTPTAAWRFISPKYQLPILERAQSIQEESALKKLSSAAHVL